MEALSSQNSIIAGYSPDFHQGLSAEVWGSQHVGVGSVPNLLNSRDSSRFEAVGSPFAHRDVFDFRATADVDAVRNGKRFVEPDNLSFKLPDFNPVGFDLVAFFPEAVDYMHDPAAAESVLLCYLVDGKPAEAIIDDPLVAVDIHSVSCVSVFITLTLYARNKCGGKPKSTGAAIQ